MKRRKMSAKVAKEKEREWLAPSDLHIRSYAHCGMCLRSIPQGQSASSWARLSVGFTVSGLQVWCERHNVNVMHIDFEGAQHPACTTASTGRATTAEQSSCLQ